MHGDVVWVDAWMWCALMHEDVLWVDAQRCGVGGCMDVLVNAWMWCGLMHGDKVWVDGDVWVHAEAKRSQD